MSKVEGVTKTYPSEYFSQAMNTVQGRIETDVSFKTDKNGVSPLYYLVKNGNREELKYLMNYKKDKKTNDKEEIADIIYDHDLMSVCNSPTLFKELHNFYHKTKGDYEIKFFEDAFNVIPGSSLCNYIYRIKKDDAISNGEIIDSLTTVGLCNFLENMKVNPRIFEKNAKGTITPSSEYLIYGTEFMKKCFDKDVFYTVLEGDTLTPLHNIVIGDDVRRFVFVVEAFELDELKKCIDGNGNTLLNWAIQKNCLKIAEYLFSYHDFSINDSYNKNGNNSACSLFSTSSKSPRLQYYVDLINESKLKDPKLSILNCVTRNYGKFDISNVKYMNEELLNSPTGVRGLTYKMIIEENEEAYSKVKK